MVFFPAVVRFMFFFSVFGFRFSGFRFHFIFQFFLVSGFPPQKALRVPEISYFFLKVFGDDPFRLVFEFSLFFRVYFPSRNLTSACMHACM